MSKNKLGTPDFYNLIIAITKHQKKDSCFQNVRNIVQTNTRNVPLPDVRIVDIESEMLYKGIIKTKSPQTINMCKKNIIENNNRFLQ